MNQEEFSDLIKKYLAGEANAAEEKTLFSHYDALQKQELEWDAAQMGEEEEVKDKLYSNILHDIKQREKQKAVLPVRWAVAVSIMLVMLSSGLLFYLVHQNDQVVSENTSRAVIKNDIPPGGNKAILTLANGSKIILDDAATGELVRQSGISITKAAEGRLTCKVIGQTTKDDLPAETVYNTIETPKGGQYRIDLPDGTKVWLNAGSSLRYPNRFAGQERKVALTGEAYFEVAKNKEMPFRVVSGKQVVEVLGTHFNINAYTDEASVKTTLLEGSVNVWLQEARQSELLNPGQQAVVRYNGSAIVVQPVKVEEAVAWKNGYFMFVDADLESIMRQLARWYDVEVAYEGNLGSLKFGGMVSRSKSIAQTLRILELTGNVRFKVTGRRVTLMP